MTQPDENKVRRLAMSVDETAEAIGVSREHAYRLVQSGTLPARRAGRRWLVSVRAVEAWLAGEAAA